MNLFLSSLITFLGAVALPTVRQSIPLILAAMGGILSEKVGVINIALEGMMLTGAFVGIWIGQLFGTTIGLMAALASGIALAGLHFILTQRLHLNHVVSGVALNLLALNVTSYLIRKLFVDTNPAREAKIEQVINPSAFLIAAILVPIIIHFVLSNTMLGLRLRAVGESPIAVKLAGLNTASLRLVGVLGSGLLASAAGAYMSISQFGRFSDDMISGRGYIALAAVICGRWKPLWAMVFALAFGFFDALQIQLQGTVRLPGELLRSIPYLAAIITAALVRPIPPAALGKNDKSMGIL